VGYCKWNLHFVVWHDVAMMIETASLAWTHVRTKACTSPASLWRLSSLKYYSWFVITTILVTAVIIATDNTCDGNNLRQPCAVLVHMSTPTRSPLWTEAWGDANLTAWAKNKDAIQLKLDNSWLVSRRVLEPSRRKVTPQSHDHYVISSHV